MKQGPLIQHSVAENESAAARIVAADSSPMPSFIGHTLVMKGELILGEDLIIEGTFDGTITDQGGDTVTVRRCARLSGNITASAVHVEDGTNLQNTVLSGRISRARD